MRELDGDTGEVCQIFAESLQKYVSRLDYLISNIIGLIFLPAFGRHQHQYEPAQQDSF